ncbi:MAG: hypothetical protein M1837_005257 [Sclerophora amabilis]|nr:MAG: hypothetical protein M1837_005257 [Sclerophora amabilis]
MPLPRDPSENQDQAVARSIAHPPEPPDVEENLAPKPRKKDIKVSYMNLPKKAQLGILCIARLADPLAATSVQSYMFYQLKYFDPSASDAKVSTQAGIMIGSKTAAQVCTGLLWGQLADSDLGGRKTVLVIGLLSSCVSYLGYGFSTSFASAIAWQIVGGAMSSNVAITRCIVAEINPEKRFRARALLLLPLCANAGMLLGPLVGGFLSSSDKEGRWRAHPYATPNIFVAAIYIIAAIGVFFVLEETLETIRHTEGSFARRKWNTVMSYLFTPAHDYHKLPAVAPEEPTVPTNATSIREQIVVTDSTPLLSKHLGRLGKPAFHRIWTLNVFCVMFAHFVIAGHLGTFTNLWAIFLSTPIERSHKQNPPIFFNVGLGMHPRDIGFAMATLGALGVVLQLIIYPLLNDRFGTVKVWRAALFIFPIVYLLAPFPSLVASSTSVDDKTAIVWLSMVCVLVLFVIGRVGVTPATTLLINDCAPHPAVRGTVHTAGTVIDNLSKSVFPVVTLAIFGQGLKIGVVGLGFWCLACLAILACVASRWVRDGPNDDERVHVEQEDTSETTRA